MRVDLFLDYRSPFAYLASTQLSALDADVAYKPIDVVEVMRQVNNQPSPLCPPKARYAAIDAARWAERYQQPFAPNRSLFRAMTTGELDGALLSRAALAAQTMGIFDLASPALFRAVWAEPAELASKAGRTAFLKAHALPEDLFERADRAEIVKQLEDNDREAAERGVFGVPTFFVEDEMFFGNDRLEFLRAKIGRARTEGVSA